MAELPSSFFGWVGFILNKYGSLFLSGVGVTMIVAITGTVLYAAEGKLPAEDIPKILDSGDRTLAGPPVPPGGLYLTRLWYEDERLNG